MLTTATFECEACHHKNLVIVTSETFHDPAQLPLFEEDELPSWVEYFLASAGICFSHEGEADVE